MTLTPEGKREADMLRRGLSAEALRSVCERFALSTRGGKRDLARRLVEIGMTTANTAEQVARQASYTVERVHRDVWYVYDRPARQGGRVLGSVVYDAVTDTYAVYDPDKRPVAYRWTLVAATQLLDSMH